MFWGQFGNITLVFGRKTGLKMSILAILAYVSHFRLTNITRTICDQKIAPQTQS